MKISVIGTGYVGLVAAVCFADAGHEVICLDSDQEKIAKLVEGKVPFYEPGLEDLFCLNRKRMTFTHDAQRSIRNSEIVFVAVGTPEMNDGSADLGATFKVLEMICFYAQSPKYIVLKSTVPIGTSFKAKNFIKEHSRQAHYIINNPEFLRQGAALEDFLKPDRVVIGTDSEKVKTVMAELYQPFLERTQAPLIFMDNTSAEMTKYAANSFLALKISFINELALLADALGADIDHVREGFTSDHRIDPSFFFPGIGYGGSCFPKDVRALLHSGKEYGIDLLVLKAANEVNERQKKILVDRLLRHFGDLQGLTIGMLGLAFKPRTDDVRRAPSLKIIEELFLKGARVKAYDPVAGANAKRSTQVPFEFVPSMEEAAKDVDALLVVTEWPEFQSFDLNKLKKLMKTPFVLDGRNVFDPKKMREHGFEYMGIGKNQSL